MQNQKNAALKRAAFFVGAIALAVLIASMLLPVRAAVTITVPYSAAPVANADLDGYPNTGAWGDALATSVPLENGASAPYGTAMLYVKHDGTSIYFRIDGSIDTSWVSTTGNHFWVGMEFSSTGTSHHSGSGSWDGVFFGESWYSPAPTYPPTPVDTNGFGKPPSADAAQSALGAMRYSGSAAPFGFTAEWKRQLNTGDGADVAFVADGSTTYNFFVTTDSNGGGSSGGDIDHSSVTNLNTLKLAPLAPPTVHDVAVAGVTRSPATVTVGGTVTIDVDVANQGTEAETFDVTAYYDSSVVGTETVTALGSGGSTTVTFSWNTAGVSPGTYTIRAVVSTVAGEVDTADNTFIDGTVTVSAPPATVHDVAVTGVFVDPTTVTVGQPVTVTVDAVNQGTVSETFAVTAYYDANAIGSQTTTLAVGGSTTLSFVWDTSGVAGSSYSVSAVVSTVSGETDVADNTFVDGSVKVNAPIVVVEASLMGKSAWPAVHRLNLAKVSVQTLFAKVVNIGTEPVYVYVEFQIRDASTGNLVAVVDTESTLLSMSGQPVNISAAWTPTVGKFRVTAVLYYGATSLPIGDPGWLQSGATKSFGFAVVGSSLAV